ncbi:hypothetical protein K6V78_09705 [Streptococcus gallolyticus]|nr:hypothetical protein [Streptococcus gallolyticus]MBY5041772.1 hypothetical protein [Streptococcus gallolyticus]
MTQQERQARKLVLKEIMKSHNVTETKARSILKELENFGLFQFSSSGEFILKVGA